MKTQQTLGGKLKQALANLINNLLTHYVDYFVICFGTVCGAVLGVLLTVFIMSTWIMLSISGVFNIYYGGLLGVLGAMMIFKIYRKIKLVELDGADSSGTKMSSRSIARLDGQPANA